MSIVWPRTNHSSPDAGLGHVALAAVLAVLVAEVGEGDEQDEDHEAHGQTHQQGNLQLAIVGNVVGHSWQKLSHSHDTRWGRAGRRPRLRCPWWAGTWGRGPGCRGRGRSSTRCCGARSGAPGVPCTASAPSHQPADSRKFVQVHIRGSRDLTLPPRLQNKQWLDRLRRAALCHKYFLGPNYFFHVSRVMFISFFLDVTCEARSPGRRHAGPIELVVWAVAVAVAGEAVPRPRPRHPDRVF